MCNIFPLILIVALCGVQSVWSVRVRVCYASGVCGVDDVDGRYTA